MKEVLSRCSETLIEDALGVAAVFSLLIAALYLPHLVCLGSRLLPVPQGSPGPDATAAAPCPGRRPFHAGWPVEAASGGSSAFIGEGEGLGRRFQREQDGGVPVAVVARGQEHLVALEGGGRHRPGFGQHGLQCVACALDLGARAAEQRTSHDRGRGLTQRAGLHILREFGHPPVPQVQIHGHGRAADRRALPRAALWVGKPPGVRDVRRQFEDAPRIEADQVAVAHGFPLCARPPR
uniref:R.sphaeroides HISI protein n=1 Tax=Cereibacter sphaeroides TaxID=1063 RepID=Q53157_CERSP|nr:unnamed protein product [Cereibacter sphaeroides]